MLSRVADFARGRVRHGRVDRGLCRHRQLRGDRAGQPQRLDRLARPAPVRLGRLLRGPAGRARERPLADRPRRRRAAGLAEIPGRLAHPRNPLRNRRRRGRPHRLHGPTGHRERRRAARPGRARRGQDAHGTGDPVRIRLGGALGAAATRTARLTAIAGPDQLTLRTSAALRGEDMRTVAEFIVSEGAGGAVRPHLVPIRTPSDAARGGCPRHDQGSDRRMDGVGEVVQAGRLRRMVGRGPALGRHPEGALASRDGRDRRGGDDLAARAARRPAQLGLPLLLAAGRDHHALRAHELRLHRGGGGSGGEWLLRAIAGSPDQMQIMYGVAGERRLTEYEVPWLKGYEGAGPVRIGNAASDQLQLDVYGEVLDALYQARRMGLAPRAARLDARAHAARSIWRRSGTEPDEGIWEVRGGRRHFTHSKVMTWVAFDRAVRSIEEFGLRGSGRPLAASCANDPR